MNKLLEEKILKGLVNKIYHKYGKSRGFKYDNKEYVTVLDFIGNSYKRSVQIAFALSSLAENFVLEKRFRLAHWCLQGILLSGNAGLFVFEIAL